MAAFKAIARFAPIHARYVQTGAAGTAIDAYLFINPTGSGEYYEIAQIAYIYDVAGGASAAADMKICASGTAPSAGTTVVSTVPDLTATARTPRTATLTSTLANRIIKPGDSLAVDTSGTLTGLAGLCIAVVLIPKVVKAVK